jgi:hypothetical protein
MVVAKRTLFVQAWWGDAVVVLAAAAELQGLSVPVCGVCVWCVVWGVWCVVCGVRCVVCGVWCEVCGVRCVVWRCGVWRCGVWRCGVYGVWQRWLVCGVACGGVACGVRCEVCGVRCEVCGGVMPGVWRHSRVAGAVRTCPLAGRGSRARRRRGWMTLRPRSPPRESLVRGSPPIGPTADPLPSKYSFSLFSASLPLRLSASLALWLSGSLARSLALWGVQAAPQ